MYLCLSKDKCNYTSRGILFILSTTFAKNFFFLEKIFPIKINRIQNINLIIRNKNICK